MTDGTRRLVLWAPIAVLLGFEYYLSSLSRLPNVLPSFHGNDKVLHAGYFFLVAAFFVRAGRFGHGWTRRRTAILILGVLLSWGVADELHQSFVPRRSAEVGDLLADLFGTVLAVALAERLWSAVRLERPLDT